MALKDELNDEVARIFRERWSERDGRQVPDTSSLKLGNDAINLDGTVLYADMTGSTSLVETHKNWFAAEIYKTFLYCAARIIRSEGGEITAYDGDRVMAVFVGDSKNTSAVRAGLKINYARIHIVNAGIERQYPRETFRAEATVGIDTSPLFVARTGIRGSNDLVWVGRAANYAAKLTELSADYPTRITAAVYDNMNKSVKTSKDKSMWEKRSWTPMAGMTIYRSSWWWSL